MLRLKRLQTRFPEVAVDIEDEDVGRTPGGDPDIGVRPTVPPGFDSLPVGGGVFDAVWRARMLAWMITFRRQTAAAASTPDGVQR